MRRSVTASIEAVESSKMIIAGSVTSPRAIESFGAAPLITIRLAHLQVSCISVEVGRHVHEIAQPDLRLEFHHHQPRVSVCCIIFD